ncbi:serine/threonine-protein kinase [Streptomyces sp. NPDC058066]|uniref:serine/threonine-protein kinase n=1 Tax=Streptomyces sp. NPDC058066 TaxID=3346323 RepID=UPI0036F019DF
MPKRVIGQRYEIRGPIKSGGMGHVWRAYDAVLERDVAIKVIRQGVAGDSDELAQRFRHEALIHAKLDHYGIPKVHDALLDAAADGVYMVMELVQGESLAEIIKVSGRLPIHWTASLGVHLCAILHHAHEISVVHRDIKPDNIMVAFDGTVRLLDFGIAVAPDTELGRLTTTGKMVGTYIYMAPEQFEQSNITPRTDLYSFGVLLYQLLIGKPPFEGSTVQLMRHHLFSSPVAPRSLRPEIDAQLDELIMELLAKSPGERPEGALEVSRRLLNHSPIGPGYLSYPGLPDLIHPTTVPVPPSRSNRIAARKRGSESPSAANILSVPGRFAAALRLFKDGRIREALVAYQELAEELGKSGTERAVEVHKCRIRAAICRIKLNQEKQALEELQIELKELLLVYPATNPLVLEVRKYVGILLRVLQRFSESAVVLTELHSDLVRAHGPDHEEALAVRNELIKIRRHPQPG